MKHRITLNKLEEGICNNIAGRLLIPDLFMDKYFDFDDWIYSGEGLPNKLSRIAEEFNVSISFLLVRMQRYIENSEKHNKRPYIIILVNKSRGISHNKAEYKLRVNVGIIPTELNSNKIKYIYPGMGWENFGQEAWSFVDSIMGKTDRQSGEFRVPVVLLADGHGKSKTPIVFRMRGWWKIIRGNYGIDEKTILIWGALEK